MKSLQEIYVSEFKQTIRIIEEKIIELEVEQEYSVKENKHQLRNSVLISRYRNKVMGLIDRYKGTAIFSFSQALNEITEPLIKKHDYFLLEDAQKVLNHAKERAECMFLVKAEKLNKYENYINIC